MQKTTDLSIDYTLVPSNVPAICIPYVFENIGDKRIEGIFKDLDIGRVERIDLVPTQNQAPNGSKVNRVFIHINWKIDEATDKIRTRLLCGKEVKVLYDGKYFWKISASRAKEVKPMQTQPVQKDTKPRIEMDDSPPRDHRGPPRDHRGPPRDNRGPPRDNRGSQREPQPPRDYRPKGDFVPRQQAPRLVPPPLAPCLGDIPTMSLQDPGSFVKTESWDEDDFQPYKDASSDIQGGNPMYEPTTPPTPDLPPRDTRPLADVDYQEKVPNQVLYEGMGTPPKVTKRKAAKKAVVAEVVAEDDAEDA